MSRDLAIKTIRERLLEAISGQLTERGAMALEAFLELPGVDVWSPQSVHLGQVSTAFDIGLPFSFLRNNRTAEAHKVQWGSAVGRGERCDPSLSSEVHAGALLSGWGADVAFIPRGSSPTPDIAASWSSGEVVDVEVARGETKQLHAAVQGGVAAFVGALRPGDVEWHIVGFIADASAPAELAAMFESAVKLRPGDFAEEATRWCVRAVPLDGREDVVGAESVELFSPSWWPANQPTYFSTSTLIGSGGNPVVLLRSLIPRASYTNPILRKANSGQRREGNPYLIAVDVSELPRAHEQLVADLHGYFSIWEHVSGVLLFEPRFYVGAGRKEWVVSIHRNAAAAIALPASLSELADRGRFSVKVQLSIGDE
jgi:hypothetical protein